MPSPYNPFDQHMSIRELLVFTSALLIVGALFWIIAGHNLSYDVGSSVNGEYTFSYLEKFFSSWQTEYWIWETATTGRHSGAEMSPPELR
jgi:hypothetical protein